MELEPITRQEQIIAGKDLEPITRMEKFLKQYGGGGGGGAITTLHINVTAVNMETMEATFTADKTPLEMQQASAIGPTWCVVSFAAGIFGEEAVSIGIPPAWMGGSAAFGLSITRSEVEGNNNIAFAVWQELADTWGLDVSAFGS